MDDRCFNDNLHSAQKFSLTIRKSGGNILRFEQKGEG